MGYSDSESDGLGYRHIGHKINHDTKIRSKLMATLNRQAEMLRANSAVNPGATYEPLDAPQPTHTPAGRRGYGRLRKVRRPVLASTAAPDMPTFYRHGGRLFAEFGAVFWWFLFWLFNGGCTALSIAAAAQWVGGRFYTTLPDWLSYWLMVPVGIILHLMISSMEQHIWQSGQATGSARERIASLSKLRITEAVIVGSIDSLTTARTIRLILVVLGAPIGFVLNIICALVGTAMALVPEPMLRYHGVSLKTLAGR